MGGGSCSPAPLCFSPAALIKLRRRKEEKKQEERKLLQFKNCTGRFPVNSSPNLRQSCLLPSRTFRDLGGQFFFFYSFFRPTDRPRKFLIVVCYPLAKRYRSRRDVNSASRMNRKCVHVRRWLRPMGSLLRNRLDAYVSLERVTCRLHVSPTNDSASIFASSLLPLSFFLENYYHE